MIVLSVHSLIALVCAALIFAWVGGFDWLRPPRRTSYRLGARGVTAEIIPFRRVAQVAPYDWRPTTRPPDEM